MISNISILGAGWLGFELAQKLRSDNYQLKLSSRIAEKLLEFKKLGFEAYQMDLAVLNENSPFFDTDLLIFCIPPSSYPANFEECLKNLMDILQRKMIGILFCSSISVYGNREGIQTEASPLNAETVSAGKIIASEEILFQSDSTYCILRMGGLVGKNRHPVYYLSGKKDLPAAEHAVNLLHLSDAMAAISHLIVEEKLNGVFNCCSPEHPNKKDFYTFIANKLLLPPPHFDTSDRSRGKIVSSEKLMKNKFHFQYPDPYQYPLAACRSDKPRR